jgi:hypothetical protein
MRSQGHAVESICRVLREQGCQVAARTYRSWKRAGRVVAARTVSDARVLDAVRDIAWTTKVNGDGVLVRGLAPEGLYGRRKMTAHLRRTVLPKASAGSVDRAMRTLGLSAQASGGTRACGPRSRPRTAPGPVTCSTGTSPPQHQTAPGLPTSPTSGRGPGFLRRVHRRRLRPADRGMARCDDQAHRPGDDPLADGAVAARP